VDVSLESRVLGSGRFFLAWLSTFSLEKSCPCGPVCLSSLITPCGEVPNPYYLYPRGEESLEEVRLALVEKVRVLRDDRAGHPC
jgi:hypothetical protein